MQRMIEIAALPNGAHRNQTFHGSLPDGWAVVQEGLELPATFPFVEVEVQDVVHYKEVLVRREVTRTREVETLKEVVKTREVSVLGGDGIPTFDEAGEPVLTTEEYVDYEVVMVPEEYTAEEWVTEQEPYTVPTVVSMTEGIMPEPVPEEKPVSLDERVQTLEESSAEMAEALDLLLSGVTE